MSLLSGTLLFYATGDLSTPRYTPKEYPQVEAAKLLWVSLWHHEKSPMAKKVCKQPRLYTVGFRPWRMRLSWPYGFQHSRIYRPTQGQAHQAYLPCGNNLPGSLQWSDLRAPAKSIFVIRNGRSKESVWGLCPDVQVQGQALPCIHLPLFRQRLHTGKRS